MSDVRRTAMGDLIDLDMLRLANEETIAAIKAANVRPNNPEGSKPIIAG